MSEERALSFGSVAEDYEATRPGWPVEPFAIAFEQFDVPERPDVVDIAAGTGKLTRTLARLAGTLVAVEPDADLRAVLQRELPDVTALEGTAEELPLETASADVACAGQAFHWFDVDRALDEIARVLRPRGIAIAGWNFPPEDGTWYDAVIDFLHARTPTTCRRPRRTGRRPSAGSRRFGGLLEIAARHEQPIDRASFQRLLGTHSALNALPRRPSRRADRAGPRRGRRAGRVRRRRAAARSPGGASCSCCGEPSARWTAGLHCACHGNCIAHKAIRSSLCCPLARSTWSSAPASTASRRRITSARSWPRAAQGSGADIVILEKSQPGAGASGIACGVVRNNYFQPAMQELMQACVEVWESDPAAYSYNPVGYMAIGPQRAGGRSHGRLRAPAEDRLRLDVRDRRGRRATRT